MKILSSICLFLVCVSGRCDTDLILTEMLVVSKMTNDLLRINIYMVCLAVGIGFFLSYRSH